MNEIEIKKYIMNEIGVKPEIEICKEIKREIEGLTGELRETTIILAYDNIIEKKLIEITKKANTTCENKNGVLKNLTPEEVIKLHKKLLKECDYCPFEYTGCEICSGLLEIIYDAKCYECNTCNKWSISEEEFKKALLKQFEEECAY